MSGRRVPRWVPLTPNDPGVVSHDLAPCAEEDCPTCASPAVLAAVERVIEATREGTAAEEAARQARRRDSDGELFTKGR